MPRSYYFQHFLVKSTPKLLNQSLKFPLAPHLIQTLFVSEIQREPSQIYQKIFLKTKRLISFAHHYRYLFETVSWG